MQLDSFAMLWSLAVTNPESSVKRIEMLDYHDDKTIDQIWYAGKLPQFRVMESDELPVGVRLGMSYKTVVLTPKIFLLSFWTRLEASGVRFRRAHVDTLSE